MYEQHNPNGDKILEHEQAVEDSSSNSVTAVSSTSQESLLLARLSAPSSTPAKQAIPSSNQAKRGRGRPKRERLSDSECSISSTASRRSSPATKKKSLPWTLDDKQKFVTGISSGEPFRKPDGNLNWTTLAKSIGRTVKEVKEFAKNFNALEKGKRYEEFDSKAAVDVWRQLASNLTMPGDSIDQVCIPQTLTVAALEPVAVPQQLCPNQPNYGNIYNYLSTVTRGSEAPDLPANDAVVVLELLEDLIKWLSKSQTVIQREFMHTRYAELRHFLNPTPTDEGEGEGRRYNTSTNPFAIPFDILEFKGEGYHDGPSTT